MVEIDKRKEKKCHIGYPEMPNYQLVTHTQGAGYCKVCKKWYYKEPVLNGSEWDYRYGRHIRKVLDMLFYIYLVLLWVLVIFLIAGVISL
jgi:hypothetical protein